MSSSMSFQDVATVTLAEADLTAKQNGEFYESPKRVIPGSGGLEWWFRLYPAGETAADKGHAGVYLWVNKLVKAKYTFAVDSISFTFTHEFRNAPQGRGWRRFATHSELRSIFRDGKVTVTCSVEFDMNPPKPIVMVKDTTTFILYEADLTVKKVGEFIKTPKRTVPYFDGFQWWMEYSPAGWKDDDKGHVIVVLYVSKPVKATLTLLVIGSSIDKKSVFDNNSHGFNCRRFASHKQLRPCFRDGKASVRIDVEFEIVVPNATSVPRLYQLYSDATDYTLEVGSKKLEVHRHLLSFVSPVFNTMLSSGESTSRKMKVPKFEYNVVKAAINFCYGHELDDNSVGNVIRVLQFTNKYQMDVATVELERYLMLNLTVNTVSMLLQYAYDASKDSYFDKCVEYYKENEANVKKTEKFLNLPPAVAIRVLKAAFELNTDFELLQYAHQHGYEFIIDELEKRLHTSMTIDDFGPIVSYAWDNNRDDLKKACAKFCTQNHADIVKLNNFISLPAGTIGNIMKLAFGVKQEEP